MLETCRGHLWEKIIVKLFASSWYIFLSYIYDARSHLHQVQVVRFITNPAADSVQLSSFLFFLMLSCVSLDAFHAVKYSEQHFFPRRPLPCTDYPVLRNTSISYEREGNRRRHDKWERRKVWSIFCISKPIRFHGSKFTHRFFFCGATCRRGGGWGGVFFPPYKCF